MKVSKCAVCGLWLPFDNQRLDDGAYSFCPCCDIEFCVDDATYESTLKARRDWLQNGAEWADSEEKPENWDLVEQLSNVIYERAALLKALKIARDGGYAP